MTDKSRLKKIGKRLRLARVRAGYSRRELAGLCGCHESTIQRCERGDHGTNLDTAMQLAKLCGLKGDELEKWL